jgi:WD40 repeat protein
MRYELAHDSLARQILDRVSGEAKARRQAELLVERAYQRYRERGILLTQEDLDEIRPHEDGINFSVEELEFIQKSKTAIARAARRRRQLVIGVISVLSVFLVFALWQWQRSVASTKALRARSLYEDAYTSRAFRMAQSAWKTLGADEDTKATISGVLSDIAGSGLERDLIHEEAVQSFAVADDEQFLLSIAKGRKAWLWDLPQRKQLLTLEHPDTLIGGAILSWEAEQAIITLCKDNKAYFWDKNGKLLFQQVLQSPIRGFDLSAKLQVAMLWTDDEILILSDSINKWPQELTPEKIVNADISPDGEYLLVATADSVQSWWLLPYTLGARKSPEFTVRGQIQTAEYVAGDAGNLKTLIHFTDGSNQIFNYSGELDTLTEYRFFTKEIAELSTLDSIKISRFAYSPPGHGKPKILFYTDSLSVFYWSAYRFDINDVPIGSIDFYTRYDEPVIAAGFSQKDQYLLTASADGRVDIWDISGSSPKRAQRWRALMQQVRFIDADKQLISTAGDNTIKIWHLTGSKRHDPEWILNNYDDRLQRFE